MRKIRTYIPHNVAALAAAIVLAPSTGLAQQAAASSAGQDDEVVQLSPFEVRADSDAGGYTTTTTLAGNRLKTDLKDLGTSLSIYNEQFMKDIGATDNRSLLQYTLGTEVGGVTGNYSASGGGVSPDRDTVYLNPQSQNRVRGLIAADNTRDLYLSSIPWDGYNIDAVDLQRGPNAILFGQGSPGGVINTRTKQASYRNSNETSIRLDQYGSVRATVDFNKVLLKDELALRFAAVDNMTKFKQKPAFEDFNREYLAARYEPKFLKKGNARTIIKVDGEIGHSNSNRPRNMPPGDRITPWFTALNKQLYNVAWMNDNHWELPGRGAAVKSRTNSDNVTENNPNYQPWLDTNFGNNYYGGSEFFFLPGQTTAALSLAINPVAYLGKNSLGVRDGNIGGLAPSQPHGVQSYHDWAVSTKQPFSSLVKDTSITDPSIFDFYNKLIDGNIKREWSHYSTYDLSLSQTFFDDSMGFDLGYHNENYVSGSYSPLIGGGTLFIDFNSVWPDGTNEAAGGWYSDGTKNPGAGRAFVQLGNGAGETSTDRESLRATAFVSHDFAKGDKDTWWKRLLGSHTVTGLASKDDYDASSQNWVLSAFTGSYYQHPMFEQTKKDNGRFWADFVPIRTVYLSDSLTGKSLGQNLGIDYPTVDPQMPDSVNLRYFDSTWTATGVDPADTWYNQSSAGTASGPAKSTQSENPLNYAGWATRNVKLIRANTSANRDLLTTSRSWDHRRNKAYGFVWQGKFWDDSIIGTAGVRHDEVSQRNTSWNNASSSDRASGDPTLVTPTVNEFGPLKRTSKSWGFVSHLNQLPFISSLSLVKRSPVDISLTYNRSGNFQTGQIYRDYFGQSLPLPEGKTKDMGVLIATKNGKYSFRINKFESSIANNPSDFIQWWNIGNNVGVYAGAYYRIKYNTSSSDKTSPRYGNNIVSDLPVPTDAAPNAKWDVDYRPLAGQTLEQAAAQEVAVINAWDKWMSDMGTLPETMARAWGFSWKDNYTGSDISNFRLTSDLVAKGYEYELNAQVTDSWRLTVNASRIESVIDNIGKTPVPGGKMTVMDYLLDFDKRINETVMGDLRIWGPGNSSTARENWNGYADGTLKAQLAQQGTVVPENRLWHVNLITNYDFKHGVLKGWSVGGAARYQSAATLGYKPVQNPTYISYDLSTKYRDSTQTDFDVWVGYTRKLFKNRIDWQVQLNIANVGVGNELIPVTVQPDGTPASYRIRPPQQIFLTNAFRF